MMESVDLVKAGKAPRIKQDESKATYEGRCGPDNAKIDWGKPWEQIDHLIRGCNPAPGAWTTLDGKQLRIFDAKPLPAKSPKGIAGKLGEIVAVERRRHHRRVRRRPLQGHPRPARRRQEDRSRRMAQDRRYRHRRHLRQGLNKHHDVMPAQAGTHASARNPQKVAQIETDVLKITGVGPRLRGDDARNEVDGSTQTWP